MKTMDSYVLLTEQMGEIINPRKRPQCVMEGICDGNVVDYNVDREPGEKICMYAGSLHKQYGIDKFIEAFRLVNRDDWQLHIYGNGDYTEEIKHICDESNNIRYCGVKTNKEIVLEEQRASLLVNPRPTADEYTKYSFPSKTLEYMASGTPVLMTKLPGMPKEYYPYLYLFEDESLDGYIKQIQVVFDLTDNELVRKGKMAQEFVLNNKNQFI